MAELRTEKHFPAGPAHVHDVATDVADVLFDLTQTDPAIGFLRYETTSGMYSPGSVVEVEVVAVGDRTLVRATARLRPSTLRRSAGEQQRLDLFFDAIATTLRAETAVSGAAVLREAVR